MQVLVSPIYSADGNVGIEQEGEFLGAYTECCYGNPEPIDYGGSGRWQCELCGTALHLYAPGYETTINVASSSETRVQEWVSTWLNRSYHEIGISISLP